MPENVHVSDLRLKLEKKSEQEDELHRGSDSDPEDENSNDDYDDEEEEDNNDDIDRKRRYQDSIANESFNNKLYPDNSNNNQTDENEAIRCMFPFLSTR